MVKEPRGLDSAPLRSPVDVALTLLTLMPFEDQESFLNRIHDQWCVLCGKRSEDKNPLFVCYCSGTR